MTDIKPISSLQVTTLVASNDQFVINKLEGASYKTDIINSIDLGPQLAAFISLGNLFNVSSAGANTGQVLTWSGTEWAPADSTGGSGNYTLPIANQLTLGGVRIPIDGNININSATGDITIPDYLPVSGGTLTGNLDTNNNITAGTLNVTNNSQMNTLEMSGLITFAAGQTFPGAGGAGDVQSVANVGPDQNGNVPLTPGDIGAAALSGFTMSPGALINSNKINASDDIVTSADISAQDIVASATITASTSISTKDLNVNNLATLENASITDTISTNDLTANGDSSLNTASISGLLSGTTAVFTGDVQGITPTTDDSFVTKEYLDSKIIDSGAGTVIEIIPGDGLTSSSELPDFTNGDDITISGTLTVKAADNTIDVSADGIKVNTANLPDDVVQTVNGQTPDENGNVELDAGDVDALSVGGGNMDPNGANSGIINFVSDQTFPSSITDDYLLLTGGTITGDLTVNGTETVLTKLTVPAPSDDTDAASKGYVDGLISGVPAGTVTSITVSDGLQVAANADNPITDTGTISVKAADTTLTVDSSGVKVNFTELNSQYLPLSGGSMTGDITMDDGSVISFSANQSFPSDIYIEPSALPDASDESQGVVLLSDLTNSDLNAASGETAATPVAVKTVSTAAAAAQSTADAALPKSGGDLTGDVTSTAKITAVTIDADTVNVGSNSDSPNYVILGKTGGTVTAGGSVTAASGGIASVNTTGDIFRGSADKVRFTVESDGTVRIGNDLAVDDATTGNKVTLQPDGDGLFEGDVTAVKFYGDGSSLTGLSIPDPITYKGTIDCTTDEAPETPTSGDLYLNLIAGEPDDTWTGLTTLTVNQFVIYKTNTWENGAVLDGTAFVTLSTDQSITGNKTFTEEVIVPTTPTVAGSATAKTYVDSEITTAIGNIAFPVTKVNNQTGDVTITAASIDALDLTDTNEQAMNGNLKMNGTSVIVFNDSQTFPTDIIIDPTALPDASDETEGAVFLSDEIDSDLNAATGETAATPLAVKTVSTAAAAAASAASTADDKAVAAQTTADAALPVTGGSMSTTGGTGVITFVAAQTFPGVLPLGGGSMDATGDASGIITFATGQTFPNTVTSVNGADGVVTITAAGLGALPETGGTLTGKLDIDIETGDPLEISLEISSSGVVNTFFKQDGSLHIGVDNSGENPTILLSESGAAALGDTTVNGLTVGAGADITGTLSVTDDITASKDISIGENLSVTGNTTLTGTLSAAGGSFSAEVTGVTPTSSSGATVIATKEYVDAQISGTGAGTVTSINNIEPGADGDVTLTAADVNAWASDGNTTATTDMNLYLKTGSGNSWRIWDNEADAPSQMVRFRTVDEANEEYPEHQIEFYTLLDCRQDVNILKDLNFPTDGSHIKVNGGSGNPFELMDENGNVYFRVNSAQEKFYFLEPVNAGEIEFDTLVSNGGAVQLADNDTDSLDFQLEDGTLYARFNTAENVEQIQLYKHLQGTTSEFTTSYVSNIIFGSDTAVAEGDITIEDNNNTALDIKDESDNIYLRFRTVTDDTAVSVLQDLKVKDATTITTDGIITVNKSVNVGVDADLEDGIIIDTITDGGNQGGRITSYVNQPSVGNKLNIFHVLNGDPDDSDNNVDYIQMTANGDGTFAGTVTADIFKGDGSQLSGVAAGAPVKISATAPSPVEDNEDGDLWWDSDAGILYVWYTDVGVEGDDTLESSSQWVDVRPGSPEAVESVNGKVGTIILNATDVGALPLTGGVVSGNQQWGGNGYDGTKGSYISANGTVYVTPASGTEAYLAYNEGSSTPTITIKGDGSATFTGQTSLAGKFTAYTSGILTGINSKFQIAGGFNGDAFTVYDDSDFTNQVVTIETDGSATYSAKVETVGDTAAFHVGTGGNADKVPFNIYNTDDGNASLAQIKGDGSATFGSVKSTGGSVTAKFGTGGLDKAFKVQTTLNNKTVTTASIDLDGNAVFSQGDPSAGDPASTIGSDGTATFTGAITAANISATNLTAMKVPYIDANGQLQSMPDVTFNPSSNSLHVATLASPSIPQATTFKGVIDATTATAPSATDGDVYSNTTSGTADNSFTGIAGLTLSANQLIFYADNQWERGWH